MQTETTVTVDTLPDGQKQVTITGRMPSASIEENEKYPYTPWNISYQKNQIQKDGERILQSLANAEYVENLVNGRNDNRAVTRATKKTERLAAELAKAQARVAELQQQQSA